MFKFVENIFIMAIENRQGREANLNNIEFHFFSKGWTVDLDNHAEKPEGYTDSWNGRLHAEDGTLAFTSVNGSKLVYENNLIVRYNGFYSFEDELIVIAKGTFPVVVQETIPQEVLQIAVNNFSVSGEGIEILGIDFENNFTTTSVIIQVPVVSIDEDDFKQNLTSVESSNEIDDTYNGLFTPLLYNPISPIICSIPGQEDVPINNIDFNDAIISFKIDSLGMLAATFLYVGNLNIPLDGIITTEGVDENIHYKRVYFSDYYNPTRVVNIKDSKLKFRNPLEFDIKTKGTILSPRINRIESNGQLKAMTVFYVMRLLTENGQVSDFSALSKGVKILKQNGVLTSGGGIKEVTNKSVVVDCYIPDHLNFKEIQLVAIEFEANLVPTTIRLVGTKLVNAIVSFEHFGSESEFKENITLSDLFKNSISWRYNSDFTTKNNKLLVSGLRNDPLYLNSKNVAIDFSLKSFNSIGETHASLLNPNPVEYNLINNSLTESFFYIKRKLFRKIEIFGNYKMTLYNKLTDVSYDFTQPTIVYDYVDRTEEVGNALLAFKTDDPIGFAADFPNLRIRFSGTKILFEPIDDLIETDLQNYSLKFSTTQVIIDMDNDTENKIIPWPTTDYEKESKLVYGGVSNGWFNGNGVKVTMHSVSDSVCLKNTDWMTGTRIPIQIKEPTLLKGVMKGEIYRLGIQWFKNGNRLFTTILGDLKIPDIGQKKREIDINGNVISTSEKYSNWKVIGDEMFAERIELQFDVRINCELSNEVDSYQIVYVERTEGNRTILSQGISAPLERMQDFGGAGDDRMELEEPMVNKWMLPSNGGPVYDYQGLLNYDINPDNEEKTELKIITTNRKAFYFDSPDFIYSKISSNFVSSCVLEYIETLATDHDRHNILGGYNKFTCGYDIGGRADETDEGNPGSTAYSSNGAESSEGPYTFGVPKFSQKIPSNLLSGNEKKRPFWVNTSVFANRLKSRTYTDWQNKISPADKYIIDKSDEAGPGEVLSGYKLNDKYDYANHAFTLASPGWFYQVEGRKGNRRASYFRVNNIAAGRNTLFLKTKDNFFTTSNIAQTPYIIKSKVNFGSGSYRHDVLMGHDSYIVSNLKRSNEDSVYGGRTEFAYAANEYIPLGEVIPVDQSKVSSQITYVQGDTYCTLYLRNKTSYKNTAEPILVPMHNSTWTSGSNAGTRRWQYAKYNAWCYAVVLESTVEPRLNNSEEFYLFTNAIDFDYEQIYNNAYLQENDLRKSIPIPYNFKDDPILNNIIAASDVKLNGDYIDAWVSFSVNEFYELDKNKGTAFNIIKEKDEIYVIQEKQTSRIFIDEKNMISPDKGGAAIQIGQGDGKSISGHEIVSNFGTSFRRSIVETDKGFVFFDELKTEMVKIIDPLFLPNSLSLHLKNVFLNDKVIDVTGYYDEEFKETNLRFRTTKGNNFVISYNELLNVFNGKIDYNNDLYFNFQNKIFTPYNNSKKIGELNRGNELLFFDVQKKLKLKVISAPSPDKVKIIKGIAVYLNANYPIFKTTFITSLGHSRTIMGTHHWYKIREGIHTLPSKNESDYDVDIRGEWCSIDLEIESKNNNQLKIFSLLNFYRESYK